NEVIVWDLGTGRIQSRWKEVPEPIFESGEFTPDGKQFVFFNPGADRELWDAEAGKLVKKYEFGRGVLAISPDSKFRFDIEADLCGVKSGEKNPWLFTIPTGEYYANLDSLNPAGDQLLLHGWGYWDKGTGRPRATPRAPDVSFRKWAF